MGKFFLICLSPSASRSAGDRRLCHQLVTVMRLRRHDVCRDGTDAARKMETVAFAHLRQVRQKGRLQRPRGEDAPKPDKVTACLATTIA